MTKKGKPRISKKLQEKASVEEGKSSLKNPVIENASVKEANSSLKIPASEIDEIFAGKKRKKPVPEKTKKPNEDSNSKPKKMKKYKKGKGFEDEDPVDSSSRPRKKMQNGLTIYREEELGFNKADAGGTPLCPFDCSCCF